MKQGKFTSLGFVVVSALLFARHAGAGGKEAIDRPTTLRALYGLKPVTELAATRTAVVLVDFQEEFVHGRLRLPRAARAVSRGSELASWARSHGILVVMVRNVASRPDSLAFAAGSPTVANVPELLPRREDLVVTKSMGGGFSRTDLDAILRARSIDTLIVAGFMTHLAVQMTASDAMVLGYRVIVASDATATRPLPGVHNASGLDADTLQRAALAFMADRVADIMPVREIGALPVTQ
ncbi:MAG TPA: cysteine hydrolase [Polyangiaceae bacterium]